MSMKEIFYKSVSGVFEQGRAGYKTVDSGKLSIPSLRGDGGCKCALGHLIDEEHYNGTDGGISTAYPMIKATLGGSSMVDCLAEYRLIDELQNAHDSSMCAIDDKGAMYLVPNEVFIEKFMEKTAQIAAAYGLEYRP